MKVRQNLTPVRLPSGPAAAVLACLPSALPFARSALAPAFCASALLALLLLTSCGGEPGPGRVPDPSSDARQRMFDRVFGDAVRLDPRVIERAMQAPAGEFVLVDTDGDGRHDVAWFIDTDPRHTDSARPLLVRAIDRDGDMHEDGAPDLDSDLYIADWNADGRVDAVIEYIDRDGDNEVDEMAMYYWSPDDHFMGRDALRVWWFRDCGGDNQLVYDVNYAYEELLCQNRTHFGGDQTFVAFGLVEGSDQWQSIWENPFIFFDNDSSGNSDESIRFSGLGDQVEALRWSFDADGDARGRRTYGYDFSITALAPGSRFVRTDGRPGSDMRIPKEFSESIVLGGMHTQPFLKREHARTIARFSPWLRTMLTWDELNANTDPGDPYERWEGVIASGNQYFPRVGGQGEWWNRRFEVDFSPTPPLRLYYSPSDGRVHLRGAKIGFMEVDFDLDGEVDARYEWVDRSGDGFFDLRVIDVDADGVQDFEWPMSLPVPIEIDGPPHGFMRDTLPLLGRTLEGMNAFVDAAIAIMPEVVDDPVARFFLDDLGGVGVETGLGEHVRRSDPGRRYYLELLRDRALVTLRRERPALLDWTRVEELCAAGDASGAARMLRRAAGLSGPPDTRAFRSYRRRLLLDVEGERRDDPVVIEVPLHDILRLDPAFDPSDCAVVQGRWLEWQEIPHQVCHAIDRLGRSSSIRDTHAGPESGQRTSGGDEAGWEDAALTFIGNPPAAAGQPYRLYHSPATAGEGRAFPHRTATAETPGMIKWESELRGYYARRGQFGFFGKEGEGLILPLHDGADGGTAGVRHGGRPGIDEGGRLLRHVDALSPGTTSGLGGVTLYLDGRPYPVHDAGGDSGLEFTHRQLYSGPVRAAVEFTAGNVVPSQSELAVHFLCLINSARHESEIIVTVSGATGEVLLAPGLTRIPNDRAFADPTSGILGSWGRQDNLTGEIGLAVMTDPGKIVEIVELEDERRVVCRLDERGQLRYWIAGDWRRGRRFPIAPTVTNWERETRILAERLVSQPRVRARAVETVGSPP